MKLFNIIIHYYTEYKINSRILNEKLAMELKIANEKELENIKAREQARRFKEACEERRARRRRHHDDDDHDSTSGYCGMLCI
jgi:replication initiation and membrane attachment protein DnaB